MVMEVALAGERPLDEGERAAREAQDDRRSVAVLNVVGLRLQDEATSICIHHDLPLAAPHLLACIVAPWSAALGGLDRLAIDHSSTGRGFTSDPLPIRHNEQVVDALEQARVAPESEPAIHRRPRWEVLRDQTPRDPASEDVEDGVHDFPQWPSAGATKRVWLWHQRLDQGPLGICQICFVSQAIAAMLPP